jgi:hypothetical protein
LGGFGIWWIIDLVLVTFNKAKDAQGNGLVGAPANQKVAWAISGAFLFALLAAQVALPMAGNFSSLSAPIESQQPAVTDQPTADPTIDVTPTTVPTPAPTPTTSNDSSSGEESFDLGYFVLSANGNIDDAKKDVKDLNKRVKNQQFIRLMGNIFELSFNLGQLEALDPPANIGEAWIDGLATLDQKIAAASDAAADYIVGDISESKMLKKVKAVNSQLNTLKKLVGKAS